VNGSCEFCGRSDHWASIPNLCPEFQKAIAREQLRPVIEGFEVKYGVRGPNVPSPHSATLSGRVTYQTRT
jgi:hypothetical protein